MPSASASSSRFTGRVAVNQHGAHSRGRCPVTITSSDIRVWPISRGVHLTQGGPITAKELVSLIRRRRWIPIQLPFPSITEESITCPKGAAHGAALSGEAAPRRQPSGSARESGTDREPASVGHQPPRARAAEGAAWRAAGSKACRA